MVKLIDKYLTNESLESVAQELIAMNVHRVLIQAIRDDDWLDDISKDKSQRKLFVQVVNRGVQRGVANFFKLNRK